ncbi:MAG: ABC transporter permease [Caldilineaceae bacterium]
MRTQALPTRNVRYVLSEYSEVVTLITFVLIFGIFAVAADNFLTNFALSNIVTFAGVYGIMAIGVAILMITGEFDLSVGSVLAVACYVFALLLNAGFAPMLAALAALIVCTILGLINGWIVVTTKIPSFIVTLGTLLAYRGIARFLGGGDFVYYKGELPTLFGILNGPITWINQLSDPPANMRYSVAWAIGLIIIATIMMTRTRLGNWIYAVGGNPGAALAQGVPVNRVKLICFALTGFMAGLAGVIQFAELKSVDPLRGAGLELIMVSASVIGGVWLTGGVGTIVGAMLGMLILMMLQQGLILLQVPLEMFQAVAGLIIITAVVVNKNLQGTRG